MKKVLSLAALFFVMISFSFAQERGRMGQRNPEDMAKMQTERLTQELTLNKSQQDSVYKYVLITAVAQQKLFAESSNDREAMMKNMQDLRNNQQAKIKSFLTEEQLKKYETYLQQQPRRPEGGRGERRSPMN